MYRAFYFFLEEKLHLRKYIFRSGFLALFFKRLCLYWFLFGKSRVRNYCILTSRGFGVCGKYRMSRHMVKYAANHGVYTGLLKV